MHPFWRHKESSWTLVWRNMYRYELTGPPQTSYLSSWWFPILKVETRRSPIYCLWCTLLKLKTGEYERSTGEWKRLKLGLEFLWDAVEDSIDGFLAYKIQVCNRSKHDCKNKTKKLQLKRYGSRICCHCQGLIYTTETVDNEVVLLEFDLTNAAKIVQRFHLPLSLSRCLETQSNYRW